MQAYAINPSLSDLAPKNSLQAPSQEIPIPTSSLSKITDPQIYNAYVVILKTRFYSSPPLPFLPFLFFIFPFSFFFSHPQYPVSSQHPSTGEWEIKNQMLLLLTYLTVFINIALPQLAVAVILRLGLSSCRLFAKQLHIFDCRDYDLKNKLQQHNCRHHSHDVDGIRCL